MMKKWIQIVQTFLFSQEFADGLRITGAVLLPGLVSSYIGHFESGLSISLGALCVSISDAPGPLQHKRNAMLVCAVLSFLMAVLTGLVQAHAILLGIEILCFSFLFSMFNVYGLRVAAIGSAALLAIILTMDKPLTPIQSLINGLLILSGGIWYTLISLFASRLLPYRSAQRALGNCIQEIAKFLYIRALFYNTKTDLDDDYKQLLAQQVIVNEKQEAVRELLFKSRQIVREATPIGRKLVLTFIDTVDLFEDITATYYDYASLRKKYGNTDILDAIGHFANELAGELEEIGVAIQANTHYIPKHNPETQLKDLKRQIDSLKQGDEAGSHLVLKKLLVNIRNIVQRIKDLQAYFNPTITRVSKNKRLQYDQFVGHQKINFQILKDNLTLRSAVFRHSLRVAIASIAGYGIAQMLTYSHHSYWILLTVAFILKPAFSLTKQRNVERLFGTLAGGAIGVLLLVFISNKVVLSCFLVLFMLGTYSFQRTKYFVMVFCVTPFILILFSFLGIGFLNLAGERVIDTAIGCTLAFAAAYFLFPSWEKEQLQTHLTSTIKANIHYLQQLIESLSGQAVPTLVYKLIRKEVYVSSANLSAAFERMLSEPKSKQSNSKEVYQFVVLNHLLFSNATMLFTSVTQKEKVICPVPVLYKIKQSINALCAALEKLKEQCEPISIKKILDENEYHEHPTDDALFKEQADYVYRLSEDIKKKTEVILRFL